VGSVLALTDTSGSIRTSYGYDDWGKLTSSSDAEGFNGRDRARWKGALWLGPEVDVYYMRNRWYEPQSGRLLSEDPAGLSGGVNPVVYGGNDPVNNTDPSGLGDLAIVCDYDYLDWYRVVNGLWTYLGRQITRMICSRPGAAGGGGRASANDPQAKTCPAFLRDPGVEAGWRWVFAKGEASRSTPTPLEYASLVRPATIVGPGVLYSEYVTAYIIQNAGRVTYDAPDDVVFAIHHHTLRPGERIPGTNQLALEGFSPDDTTQTLGGRRVAAIVSDYRHLHFFIPGQGAGQCDIPR